MTRKRLRHTLVAIAAGFLCAWVNAAQATTFPSAERFELDDTFAAFDGGKSQHVLQPSDASALAVDKTKLVLVTHGYNGDMGWVNAMADSIADHLASLPGTEGDDWAVIAYDWTNDAGGTPMTALANGAARGVMLGDAAGNFDIEQAHLIGHSAGAALVEGMATRMGITSPDTVIHTTFLDAYAPAATRDLYGSSADWSDHYVNVGDFPYTNALLPNAHNVVVDRIDPTPTPFNWFEQHSWPHEFYQASIDDPLPVYEGFGFELSQEIDPAVGTWDPGATYPVGETTTLGLDNTSSTSTAPAGRMASVGGPLNFTNALTAIETIGLVTLDENDAVLEASAPPAFDTVPPVWLEIGGDLTQKVNTLTFDMEFTSELGAEGLFIAFVDNIVVGLIDERFALPGLNSYSFYVGDLEAGAHSLAFRLDPYTGVNSSVHLTNVEFHFATVAVPEPATLILAAFSFVGLGSVAHRRRRAA